MDIPFQIINSCDEQICKNIQYNTIPDCILLALSTISIWRWEDGRGWWIGAKSKFCMVQLSWTTTTPTNVKTSGTACLIRILSLLEEIVPIKPKQYWILYGIENGLHYFHIWMNHAHSLLTTCTVCYWIVSFSVKALEI